VLSSDVTDSWPGRPTPFLLVDQALVAANVAEMADSARRRGLTLRPHAKTHKSADIARMQLAGGAVGLTVATVAEAEAFAGAGCDDLFVAYPLWVDAAKGARLRDLSARASLTIGIDSVTGARALAAQLPGARVLVEVDSGQHRSGCAPPDAGALAEVASRAGLEVAGVFTFPGHSYAPGAAAAVAAEEAAALHEAAESLRAHGSEPRVVSGGSTPSAAQAHGDVLTELRPGVYVFNDAQQWELGTVDPDRLALTCVATVVSHGSSGEQVVLDSGSKVLGADRAAWSTGFGRLIDHPDARITLQSEHHAVVAWDGSPLPELGSRLRVVPNHVCVAVNLADELVLTDGGTWPVTARGANT
jgi:D-serine deaminase-like pyridoxal phosphate-dependent protein